MMRFSSNLLSTLSDFIADQIGLHFPEERWRDLQRGIETAAPEFHFADPESFLHWLLSSPLTRRQIEILSSHLTVGETYFFRDRRTFEVLQQQILPDLIRSRRQTVKRLRIWSAACCTGEEPYSLAILLDQLIPDIQNWNITILGTDINPNFLQKATGATYNQWSFRDTPKWLQERYFKKIRNDVFALLPAITKMVIFSYLNLAEDCYPSLLNDTNAMDLILCRNVLMYFAPERAKRAIENLYRSLIPGGWLIVSPTEASSVLFPKFKPVNYPGVFLYQKSEAEPQSAEAAVMIKTFPDFPQPEAFPFAEQSDPPLPLPTSAENYEQALESYQEGRYSETAELLSGRTEDLKAAALLARTCANQGKIEEARRWIEQAIEGDKLNAVFHYLRATILQEQGEIEGAIASLKRALYIDPNFVLAHFTLGTLAARYGKTKESQKYFNCALLLLKGCKKEDILPESDGITAGRFIEIIRSSAWVEETA